MEINDQLQHYFSSEPKISTFCDFLKLSFTSILLFDLENQHLDLDDFNQNQDQVKIFSSCVSTYYLSKINTITFDNVDQFSDFLLDTQTKVQKLNLDVDQFWVNIFYKLSDKINVFITKITSLNNNVTNETLYHKMDSLEQLMLSICNNSAISDIVEDNYKYPFYKLVKKSAFDWLENIKLILDQEIYCGYNYASNNGVLDSYKKLCNIITIVQEYINRITIEDLKIELNSELFGLYTRYLNMLQSNETFVNTNIVVLYDVYTTALKLYVDEQKIIKSDTHDIECHELIIFEIQEKIINWFEHSIRNTLRNSCFDTDGLMDIINQLYNPHLELTLNKTIFVKVIKNLVSQLKTMILTQDVMIYKNENGIKLNNMIQQLKNNVIEIINQNKMSDKSFEFVTNTFSSIDLMTIYILTKPNLKDRLDEQRWEDRFLERFHDKVIYNKLYQAKCRSIAVTTKLTDVSIELAEAGKVSGIDLLNKSQVKLEAFKAKATSAINTASTTVSTNVQYAMANAYLFEDNKN
jgi:hypothetical protein